MKHKRSVMLVVWVLLASLLLASLGAWGWIWGEVQQVAAEVHQRYGVDLPAAMALFAVGEVLFLGSIAMMLREAGQRVTWKKLHEFKIRDLNLGSRSMMGWLWVNRLSWIVPWLVVIAMSWGHVPWPVTTAALAEVAATFALGMLVSLGLRLPWWNSERSKQPGDATAAEEATVRIATLEDVPGLAALEREVWGGAPRTRCSWPSGSATSVTAPSSPRRLTAGYAVRLRIAFSTIPSTSFAAPAPGTT